MRLRGDSLGSIAARLAAYALVVLGCWVSLGCKPPALETSVAGTGALTEECSNHGGSSIPCPGPGDEEGHIKCLTAVPAEDFIEWGEDCDCDSDHAFPGCDAANQCEIDVAVSYQTCTAIFCQAWPLSVGVVGSGDVESAPSGIDCPHGSCTAYFCDSGEPPVPAVVQLTPKPRPGWYFVGWEGSEDCTDDGEVAVVTMDFNRHCAARFAQPEVQVSVLGSGAVQSLPLIQNCRAGSAAFACTRTVATGLSATFVALPDPLAQLQSWGGDCAGTESPGGESFEVDPDQTCQLLASFSTVASGAESGVLEIVSVADDETLLPDGGLQSLSGIHGLDTSADLSQVSFASTGQNGLVRDRSLGTTREIRPPAVEPSAFPEPISLAADGRAVAYQYRVPRPLDFPLNQVYRRNLVVDPLEPAEQISTFDPDAGIGEDPDGGGSLPSLSGNGRYLVYLTQIPYLRGDPESGFAYGVAVHDSCVGAPPEGAGNPPAPECLPGAVAVSYDDNGEAHQLVSPAAAPRLSRDGRYVLYHASHPTSGAATLFRHDRDSDDDGLYDEAGQTATVAVVEGVASGQGPFFLDASGRYVGFRSTDPTLDGNANPPESGRAYLRDTCAGGPTGCAPSDHLLSVDSDGVPLPGPPAFDFGTKLTDVSGSGRYVGLDAEDRRLFDASETNFNGRLGVVRDTCIGATGCTPSNRLVSRRTNGTPILLYGDTRPQVSDDGSLAVVFGPRNALVASPDGDLPEVLLSVTGFVPDPGGTPVITARSPINAPAGSPAFLLSVRGRDFVPGAHVTWNTQPRTTIFVSPEKLQVWLTEDDLDVFGVLGLLRVVNPGGAASNTVPFTVFTGSAS